MKCAGSHGAGECTIPRKDENIVQIPVTDGVTGAVTLQVGHTVKCANCDVVGHTAGAKDCPRKLAIISKMESRRNAGRVNRPSNIRASALRAPGVSYAIAAGSRPAVRMTSGQNSVPGTVNLAGARNNCSKLDADCQKFFGKDIFTCLEKLGGFASQYESLQSEGEKKRALFGLMVSLQLNDQSA